MRRPARTTGRGSRSARCARPVSKDELRDLILRQLEERRHDELRRRQTLVGPHRDDLGFTIGGRDARAFASQGQQRSVALALKMAEVELSFEVVGTRRCFFRYRFGSS